MSAERSMCVVLTLTLLATTVSGFHVAPLAASNFSPRVHARMSSLEEDARHCLNGECSLQTVEELLTGLVERRDQLDELIDVLQQQESSRLALSAMSLEEQAAQCLEEGCPIDTVETLVNELETAARTLSGQGKSHRYVDELISLLSTSQGMPVSKPPLSSLSAPFVVSPAKVLS